MSYRCHNLAHTYDAAEVLHLDQLDLQPGQFTAIIGPNGAGKSTLLSILAGLQPHYTGTCQLEGREMRDWPRDKLTRTVSFLPQKIDLAFPFTAEQVVFMGRTPHCEGLYDSPEDAASVEQAMRLTDTLDFRERDYRSLSGGERQRVILASALAQAGQILLLDEPATFLDLKHQLAVYRLLRDLAEQGRTVVAVTHDLNIAAATAHRMLVLYRGRAIADGDPKTALSEDVMRCVFEVAPHEVPWMFPRMFNA